MRATGTGENEGTLPPISAIAPNNGTFAQAFFMNGNDREAEP